MTSKKTFKKQNRKLRAELTELRATALTLVDAIQNGTRSDIDSAAETVQDLIPGAPWTVQRIFRAMGQWKLPSWSMPDDAPPPFASGGQVTSIADTPEWAKTIYNLDDAA